MAKSKYPEKIDTSVELPHVRDNILDIGSDVINSIRTAIFQIEKTLGVNPHGVVGNTVSTRISRSLDSRGNIKKEALDRINVISGPIVDSDVSKVAAIHESKLKLDFPTQLLQDEVSILNRQIQSIIDKVDELNYILSTHVNIEATNRHKAKAITVEAIDKSEASFATSSLEESTLQSALETIYDSHINYDGTDISEENNSHQANQVFFDSTNITQVTSEDDVQGAIEDIALASFFQAVEHQDLFHANGALRNCVITRDPSSDLGVEIAEESSVSFSIPTSTDSSKTSNVTFDTPVDIDAIDASKSDILTISDGITSSNYEIESFTLSPSLTSIESVSVYGTFTEDSDDNSVAQISKNTKTVGNKTCLLASAREVPGSTSSSYLVQVCNPNSAAIITDEIKPLELTSLSKVEISIDGEDSISLDLYHSSFNYQSIDTIILKINEQVAENSYMISAYRLDKEDGGSELVIAHNLPSSEDNDYTLEVTGGELDGTGLSEDSGVIKATYGNKYFIEGYPYQDLIQKLDAYGSEMSFSSGVNYITSIGGDLDFKKNKIYAGDLLTITNSSDDNGTYVVSSVSSEQIVLSEPVSSVGFSGISTQETRFLVYSNSVSLSSMEFDEIESSLSSMVADIFLNSSQEVYLDKRIEYSTQVNTKSQSLITIIDFDGDDYDVELSMIASLDSSGNVQLILDDGDPVILSGDRSFKYISSGIYNITLKLLVDRVNDISTEISSSSLSELDFSIYVYPSVNKDTNLHIARVSYDNFRGEITGGDSRSFTNNKQTRRIKKTLVSGNVGIDEITSSAKEELIYKRFSETRSNGVVNGLVVSNIGVDSTTVGDIYTFDISAGTAYVSGKRFEIPLIEGFVSGIPSSGGGSVDNFYIAVDEFGNIVAKPAGGSSGGSSCESPFGSDGFAILASVEKSGSVISEYDLRLLISDLDNRILNAISVSPVPGMGHFTSVSKAIKYAKRFYDIYPGAGTPTIHLKSGIHKVVYDLGVNFADITTQKRFNKAHEQGIWINFPVNIVGEGESTVLDIVKTYNDYPLSGDDRANSGATKNDGYIHIAGPGLTTTPTADVDVITSGKVVLKDFSMRLSGIQILDPTLYNGDSRVDELSTISYVCPIVIDNIKFDFSEKTDFKKNNMAIVVDKVNSEASQQVGNISIANCTFINSLTRLKVWTAQKWYKFNFSYNTLDPAYGVGEASPSSLLDEATDRGLVPYGNYFIYQDSQDDHVGDHISIRDNYYNLGVDVTDRDEDGYGRSSTLADQNITFFGNSNLSDYYGFMDQKQVMAIHSYESRFGSDYVNINYKLLTHGSVRFNEARIGGFVCDLESTFKAEADFREDVTIGQSSSDILKVRSKTYFQTTYTKGIGIGVEDFRRAGSNPLSSSPDSDRGTVIHVHNNEDAGSSYPVQYEPAFIRFTNAKTGTSASDAEDAGQDGPGCIFGIGSDSDLIISNYQKDEKIFINTTDDDGRLKSKLKIDGKGWMGLRSGGTDNDGDRVYPPNDIDYPLDVRGYRRDGYVASIFNDCNETDPDDNNYYKGDVLLLGLNHEKPSYQSRWIKFTALDGESGPSSATTDTVGGVRGTAAISDRVGVDIKAAFFNFSDARETTGSSRKTIVDAAPEPDKTRDLFPNNDYNYVFDDSPQLTTPRWIARGADDDESGNQLGDILYPTTRAHPMIVLGGSSNGDPASTNDHYYSKVYGGRGVQYYTGAQDFGEWLKIGDINEWPEILELELNKDNDSDLIIINREIFGLEEGMVVYIRDAMIWRSGPGTPMVITNRACLVGNANWKEDGYSGEVVSFVGQVPVVVKGSAKDGDYLVPDGNHCVAIDKDDITFEQYRKVIGTCWESISTDDYSDGEFVKALCAIGIK